MTGMDEKAIEIATRYGGFDAGTTGHRWLAEAIAEALSALPAAPMPGVKAAATEGWLACHRQIREMFEGYSVEHMVAALEPSDSYELQQVFTELEAGAPPAAAPGVEALLDFEPQIAFSHFGPERSLRWILEWFYKSNGIEEAKAKAVTESYVAALSELLATRTAASKAEPQP